MKKYVIIVAGGRGTRMMRQPTAVDNPTAIKGLNPAAGDGNPVPNAGGVTPALPKQFMDLGGLPVLMRTINVFAQALPEMELIVVLGKDIIPLWHSLCAKYDFDTSLCRIAEGGKERFFSVKNGLALIPQDEGDAVVGVHDGVRPLVSREVIRRAYKAAEENDGVVPVMPSVESVRLLGEDNLSRAINRSRVMMVQTPQVFRLSVLRRAYEQPFSPNFTDDASVVESAGYSIHLVEGNRENIKLTTPADLLFARALINSATD